MAEERNTEKFGFQTEAKQLLKLMIHSLYSCRESFLRELISNASDAIDKHRFAVLADTSIADVDEYRIRISFDKEAGTLSVLDNGIGMTRDEVIDHLGTIAKSGTSDFLSKLTGDQKKDASLIGQFGVGFYSAFMVADRVEVRTKKAGMQDALLWASTGEDEFTIEQTDDIAAGTEVTLYLKSDSLEYADSFRVKNIIQKYSDHIGVPVEMEKEIPVETDDEADEEKKLEGQTVEWEAINSARALWTRSRADVGDEEYKEFYKHVSHDFDDPRSWSHNRVEGKLEYTSLLYLPKRAPFDLWNRESPRGLKFYVQRVFIMDNAEQFLPLYLRFIKGIIDCNDLPLNVSREILQQDDRVTTIRTALVKRVLTMLGDIAEKEPDQYQEIWDEFGEVLKEGAGEDFANREPLLNLLRFGSTSSENGGVKDISLESYIERSGTDQDKIYYLVADSYENASNSPHLEIYKKHGIEVLLLFDRIDEWMMSMLSDFKEKTFHDISRGDVDLPNVGVEEDLEEDEQAEKEGSLGLRMKEVLGDRVDGVKVSKRLTDSPACLVLGEFGISSQMRRMMEISGQQVPDSKPNFEYNPDHPLVKRLDAEQDEKRFDQLLHILFDQASLAEGGILEDSSSYVARLNTLLLELLAD